MHKKLPKVSIGIVCYNHEAYIEACLDSIRSQDYPNIEVLVSDDGSKDQSRAVIDAYQMRYPDFNLKTIHPTQNLGLTGNFNHTAKALEGAYHCIFAGDDIMLPGRIAKQVEALENNPEASFCYSNCEWFDSDSGKKICNHFGLLQQPPKDLDDLVKDFTIPTPTLMVRASQMPNPPYRDELNYICDFYQVVELMQRGEGIYIPQVLVRYRKHGQSITAQNFFVEDRKKLISILQDEVAGIKPSTLRDYKKLYYYACAMDAFQNGQRLKGFGFAFKTFPRCLSSVKWAARLGHMVLASLKGGQK